MDKDVHNSKVTSRMRLLRPRIATTKSTDSLIPPFMLLIHYFFCIGGNRALSGNGGKRVVDLFVRCFLQHF
jgi:hypothetical protein